jgi:hypothetical protein
VSAKLSRSGRASRWVGAADSLLAAEALLWLALARLLVVALPFRILARALGRSPGRSGRPPAPQRVRRIAWSLNAAGRRSPWRCKCLERAIAGTIMLRLRGHRVTLVLGIVRTAPRGALQAHAWLRCGELPVVGEEGSVEHYAVVARLSPPPRESRRA